MKKILLVAAATMMVAISSLAQRLHVVDSNGNAIPYALVLGLGTQHIGITDLEGVLNNVAGANNITVAHVAFKTKSVKLNGEDAVVTLEDVDFKTPEMPIQTKPYIYVQTYFRMYYYTSTGNVLYHRAGLTDNIYDLAKDTVTTKTNEVLKVKYASHQKVLDNMFKGYDRLSQIPPSPRKFEDRLKKANKPLELVIGDLESGKRCIRDDKNTIGYIIDDIVNHKRRIFYDSRYIILRKRELKGTEKDKQEMENSKEKNQKAVTNALYNIDDNGNDSPENLIMRQNLVNWDFEGKDGDMHCFVILQVFVTDRCYVTKEELKKRQKDNKIKMDYLNIRQFEYDHNIPALPTAIQKEISEMWGTIE